MHFIHFHHVCFLSNECHAPPIKGEELWDYCVATTGGHMKTWSDQIRDLQDQAKANAAAREQQAVEAFTRRTTPVQTRLEKLINSMPESERIKPRPLSFFSQMLLARHRGKHAHVGETGEALRALGWTRKRDWSDAEYGYRAMWWPPQTRPR